MEHDHMLETRPRQKIICKKSQTQNYKSPTIMLQEIWEDDNQYIVPAKGENCFLMVSSCVSENNNSCNASIGKKIFNNDNCAAKNDY